MATRDFLWYRFKVEAYSRSDNSKLGDLPDADFYFPILAVENPTFPANNSTLQSSQYQAYSQNFENDLMFGSTSYIQYLELDSGWETIKQYVPLVKVNKDINPNWNSNIYLKYTEPKSGYYLTVDEHSGNGLKFFNENGEQIGSNMSISNSPFRYDDLAVENNMNIYGAFYCIKSFDENGNISNIYGVVGVRQSRYGNNWTSYGVLQTLTTANKNTVITFLNALEPFVEFTDPYQQGGASGGGGGSGTFDGTSDNIDFPSLPTLSAVGTGFVTLYTPSTAQLANLANYMWQSSPQTIEFWKKVIADPIDLILGLNIVPVATAATGVKSIVIGGVDTEVSMTYTDTQYVEIQCGSINVPEYWGAYLDYSPYTKIEIYLPYCGVHPLSADEVVGKTIEVRYHVDILSGACMAYVKCGGSVLYQFAGNCAAQIPVTANQFGDMVRSAISIAASIGSMVATEGATAPFAIGTIASAASNSTGLKPHVEKSGAIGGMSGQLGIQYPYLLVTRPATCIPADQNKFIGYPAYVTKQLSELTGYNEISSIHLEGIDATGNELSEIETILKTGVIF